MFESIVEKTNVLNLFFLLWYSVSQQDKTEVGDIVNQNLMNLPGAKNYVIINHDGKSISYNHFIKFVTNSALFTCL